MLKQTLIAIVVGLFLVSCSQSKDQFRIGAKASVEETAPVLLVGNSVSGTVSFIHDDDSFSPIGTVNVIPDFNDRISEMKKDPLRYREYEVIREAQVMAKLEPHNGDRFVDDMFLSLDGKTLFVSRSNLGDIAAFDLTRNDFPMLWRTAVEGHKADHATISPDGKRIIVSAALAKKSLVLDPVSGKIIGSFDTGTVPHQNDFSADGRHIYNGSIGIPSFPHIADSVRGHRELTVVDASDYHVIRRYPFSKGVRPTIISSDEKVAYIQLSYLNGLIKFDLEKGIEINRRTLELSNSAKNHFPRFDDYPHNVAHHGLALSGDGSKICDAGTIDNNVSIISSADDLAVLSTLDLASAELPTNLRGDAQLPYWSSTSADGNSCYVTLGGSNRILKIDYQGKKPAQAIAVGTFPQRNRIAQLASIAAKTLKATTPSSTVTPLTPKADALPAKERKIDFYLTGNFGPKYVYDFFKKEKVADTRLATWLLKWNSMETIGIRFDLDAEGQKVTQVTLLYTNAYEGRPLVRPLATVDAHSPDFEVVMSFFSKYLADYKRQVQVYSFSGETLGPKYVADALTKKNLVDGPLAGILAQWESMAVIDFQIRDNDIIVTYVDKSDRFPNIPGYYITRQITAIGIGSPDYQTLKNFLTENDESLGREWNSR